MPSIKLTFIPQPHSRLLKSPTNTTCVGKLDGGVDVKQTNSANICVYLLPTQRVSESSRPRWACQVVGMFIVTCWSYNSITCSVSILLPWAPVQILQGQERQKWESRDQSYESPTFQISRYLNSVFYKKKLDADRLGRTCLKPFRLVPAAAGQNPGPFFLARCSFQHNLTGHHFTQRTQQTPARSDHVHWFQDRPAAFARRGELSMVTKGGGRAGEYFLQSWTCPLTCPSQKRVPDPCSAQHETGTSRVFLSQTCSSRRASSCVLSLYTIFHPTEDAEELWFTWVFTTEADGTCNWNSGMCSPLFVQIQQQ